MASKDTKQKLKDEAAKMVGLAPTDNLATAKLMQKADILNLYSPLISQLIPKGSDTTVEQIAALCAIAMSENPDIANCTMQSILNCMVKTAILDLNPLSMFNEVFFIPRKKRLGSNPDGSPFYEYICNFQMGYEGWITLLWRNARVKRLSVEVVHIDDQFEDIRGSKAKIVHISCGKTPLLREDIRCAYAIIGVEGMDMPITCILYLDKIEQLRKMGLSDYEKDKEKLSNAWAKSYDGMAKSKVIHQIARLLPLAKSQREALKSELMIENVEEKPPLVLNPAIDPIFDYTKIDLESPSAEELIKFYELITSNKLQPFSVQPEFIAKLSVAIENGLVDIKPIPVILMNAFKIIEEAVYKIEQQATE
jgi:recombinational DNA repair protein RecT